MDPLSANFARAVPANEGKYHSPPGTVGFKVSKLPCAGEIVVANRQVIAALFEQFIRIANAPDDVGFQTVLFECFVDDANSFQIVREYQRRKTFHSRSIPSKNLSAQNSSTLAAGLPR